MFGGMWNFIRNHLIDPWLEADPADRLGLILKWLLVIVVIGAIIAALHHFFPFMTSMLLNPL